MSRSNPLMASWRGAGGAERRENEEGKSGEPAFGKRDGGDTGRVVLERTYRSAGGRRGFRRRRRVPSVFGLGGLVRPSNGITTALALRLAETHVAVDGNTLCYRAATDGVRRRPIT